MTTAGSQTRWTAIAYLLATLVYVGALIPNLTAGMPMPPLPVTRALASLSVFAGAPAIAFFVVSIARRQPPHRAAHLVLVTCAWLFATLAVMNRVAQVAILRAPARTVPAQFDLYAPSVANFIEMFAWDMCLGVASLTMAWTLSSTGYAWPRRLFALTASLLFAGEVCYLLTLAGAPATSIGVIGMVVSVVGWVITLPSAVVLTLVAGYRAAPASAASRAVVTS